MDQAIAGEDTPRAGTRGRAIWGLALFLVMLAVAGGVVVAFVPRNGQTLPQVERIRLLEQAGLPEDFPVHPSARRMTQPAQGGVSYTLNVPAPDVLLWQRDTLERDGYQVFNADVAGQDEFFTHWLYFKGSGGTTGAIIIRPQGGLFLRSSAVFSATEVKILSAADSRLAGAATGSLPARQGVRVPTGAGGAGR